MIQKPNFFLAGAAKSGTSSLFHYLNEHPQIYMSPVKEPHYLCHHHFPEQFSGPGDEGFSHGVIRTLRDYEALFEPVTNESVIGEASVYYLYYPDTAKLIKEFNPEAKVVLILRNPVQRAYSAYMHTLRDGRESLSFEQALADEPRRKAEGYQPLWWYKEVGLYSAQVERYLETFDSDHLRIYLYEDLRPIDSFLEDLLTFLNVDPKVQVNTSAQHNASGVPRSRWVYNFFARPNPVKELVKRFLPHSLAHQLGQRAKNMTLQKVEIDPMIRKQLTEFFRSDIRALETLIHRDLSKWTA